MEHVSVRIRIVFAIEIRNKRCRYDVIRPIIEREGYILGCKFLRRLIENGKRNPYYGLTAACGVAVVVISEHIRIVDSRGEFQIYAVNVGVGRIFVFKLELYAVVKAVTLCENLVFG